MQAPGLLGTCGPRRGGLLQHCTHRAFYAGEPAASRSGAPGGAPRGRYRYPAGRAAFSAWVRGPRRAVAPRPLAPLGFAGPPRPIAAELLAIRGPFGPFDSILFFRKTAIRVVGVSIRGAPKLIATRRILSQHIHTAIMKSTGGRDYPPPPHTHNMHTPSNAPHNPLQAAWLVNAEGPRQRRPVPFFGAPAPPDMDLRNVGEGLASRLVRGQVRGLELEQHRKPKRWAGAGAGVAGSGQRGSLAPPPAGAFTSILNRTPLLPRTRQCPVQQLPRYLKMIVNDMCAQLGYYDILPSSNAGPAGGPALVRPWPQRSLELRCQIAGMALRWALRDAKRAGCWRAAGAGAGGGVGGPAAQPSGPPHDGQHPLTGDVWFLLDNVSTVWEAVSRHLTSTAASQWTGALARAYAALLHVPSKNGAA
jgi:hypothetical protein